MTDPRNRSVLDPGVFTAAGQIAAEVLADRDLGGLRAWRELRRMIARTLPTEEAPMPVRPVLVGARGRRSNGQMGLGIDESMTPTMRRPLRGVWRIRRNRMLAVFTLEVFAAGIGHREAAVRAAARAREERQLRAVIGAWD